MTSASTSYGSSFRYEEEDDFPVHKISSTTRDSILDNLPPKFLSESIQIGSSSKQNHENQTRFSDSYTQISPKKSSQVSDADLKDFVSRKEEIREIHKDNLENVRLSLKQQQELLRAELDSKQQTLKDHQEREAVQKWYSKKSQEFTEELLFFNRQFQKSQDPQPKSNMRQYQDAHFINANFSSTTSRHKGTDFYPVHPFHFSFRVKKSFLRKSPEPDVGPLAIEEVKNSLRPMPENWCAEDTDYGEPSFFITNCPTCKEIPMKRKGSFLKRLNYFCYQSLKEDEILQQKKANNRPKSALPNCFKKPKSVALSSLDANVSKNQTPSTNNSASISVNVRNSFDVQARTSGRHVISNRPAPYNHSDTNPIVGERGPVLIGKPTIIKKYSDNDHQDENKKNSKSKIKDSKKNSNLEEKMQKNIFLTQSPDVPTEKQEKKASTKNEKEKEKENQIKIRNKKENKKENEKENGNEKDKEKEKKKKI